MFELFEQIVTEGIESIAICCRKSSGFSRGASIYRGVTRFVHHGWINAKYTAYLLVVCTSRRLLKQSLGPCLDHLQKLRIFSYSPSHQSFRPCMYINVGKKIINYTV